MDKNKSEKLKEVLSHNLSSEDIEKKLKEEIKNNALKKEKKKEEHSVNILLYLVIIITILLLSIVVYLFTDDNEKIVNSKNTQIIQEKNLTSSNLEKNLILINNNNKTNGNKNLIPLEKIEEEIIIEEDKEKEIANISSKNNEKTPKETLKIEEVIKEKIVTKTIKLDKKNFKEYYNSSKYNSLNCFNFKSGDIFPTVQCKRDLKKFLIVNKNAIRFEVIPVIAEDDNKIFNKMESNLKNMDKDFLEKVKEYMFKGLSRERVLETSWYIKDTLGEDTILTPTNYYVKSKQNNKGIIIKAYH